MNPVTLTCCICFASQKITDNSNDEDFMFTVPLLKLPCQHELCMFCLNRIKQDNKLTCPVCRQINRNALIVGLYRNTVTSTLINFQNLTEMASFPNFVNSVEYIKNFFAKSIEDNDDDDESVLKNTENDCVRAIKTYKIRLQKQKEDYKNNEIALKKIKEQLILANNKKEKLKEETKFLQANFDHFTKELATLHNKVFTKKVELQRQTNQLSQMAITIRNNKEIQQILENNNEKLAKKNDKLIVRCVQLANLKKRCLSTSQLNNCTKRIKFEDYSSEGSGYSSEGSGSSTDYDSSSESVDFDNETEMFKTKNTIVN
ncbi:cg30-1 [Sucra jujuba nucleopolyhedrovirus]|uniref:Cg30-1 n=1 Tax=Sucra jujuba nucleopolyhedrovirus TaxID=1563660 RepID=A0A097P907_9ABAC|nr:cg30-1 [Sucra jujuba nucleopolyhedrovirus]AIU41311.1 cg30-1 [Sucra jujuba nucleopolyhedrovirus]